MYGCSQPRELWFIDFNHVHVHVPHMDVLCIGTSCFVLICIGDSNSASWAASVAS